MSWLLSASQTRWPGRPEGGPAELESASADRQVTRVCERSSSTRVTVFTGKDDSLVRSTSLKAGASAFFAKPFDDEEFLAAVRLALSAT